MDCIDLWLPWPLSVNSMWRSYQGRTILSKAGREWKRDAQGSILHQKKHGICIEGPVEIIVSLVPPTKRAYDIDNKAKVILDALVSNAVLLEDDCNHIVKLTLAHAPDKSTEPGAYVEIWPRDIQSMS